ncbi:MAG: spermidine/putrescine ABC transporter permease PotB, partial [Desulfofustis sp.]|nr:spermidine/putrescine ABC transporter permease PotB [Desulfofustis sp.]
MKSRTRTLIITLIGSWLVLFGVLPILLLVVASFLGQDPEAFFKLSFSVEAYRQLIDPGYLMVLLRSVWLAALTTVFCLTVGYPFAWLTARLNARSRLLVLILLMIPFWTNSLVRTYAIRMVLGTQGLLNKLLLQLGLIEAPIRLLYT